jgi:hypothetical protein
MVVCGGSTLLYLYVITLLSGLRSGPRLGLRLVLLLVVLLRAYFSLDPFPNFFLHFLPHDGEKLLAQALLDARPQALVQVRLDLLLNACPQRPGEVPTQVGRDLSEPPPQGLIDPPGARDALPHLVPRPLRLHLAGHAPLLRRAQLLGVPPPPRGHVRLGVSQTGLELEDVRLELLLRFVPPEPLGALHGVPHLRHERLLAPPVPAERVAVPLLELGAQRRQVARGLLPQRAQPLRDDLGRAHAERRMPERFFELLLGNRVITSILIRYCNHSNSVL